MSVPACEFSVFSVQDHYPDGPRTVARYYEETLENMVLAEELGYSAYWVAEHHFHEYGVIPNPAVFLAAASQRTSRIGLGVAVSVLPFRNPLLAAENYAMVDMLSQGRLILGVGSGYLKHEFAGFRLSGEFKREIFDEKLDVLTRALAGEQIEADSDYVKAGDVTINVQPVQQPTPPIYVAVLRKEVVYHVGKAGRRLLSVPYATVTDLAEVGEIVDQYKRGWADGGHAGEPPAIGFAFHAYIADTDEQAKAQAEAAFDAYVASRLYGKSAGWDEIAARRYCIFGNPETALDRVREMHGLGVRNIMLLADFGALDQTLVHRSLRLFASEVAPEFGIQS